MDRQSVSFPPELKSEIHDAVDYPDETFSQWVRDACRLRLELDNDRETIDLDL